MPSQSLDHRPRIHRQLVVPRPYVPLSSLVDPNLHQSATLTYLTLDMQRLFPQLGSTASATTATTRQTATARHPPRYRINFTAGHHPLQSFYFDELPNLRTSPPLAREPCISMALEHHANCTNTSTPRQRTICYISTFGPSQPTTQTMIKVCPRCLPILPDISASSPNESYARVLSPLAETWTKIEAVDRLDYYTLPPAPCTREHDLVCPHTHCQDPTNCICNSLTPGNDTSASSDTCIHTHCPDATHCSCTIQNPCPDALAHAISENEPHPNCLVLHCPDFSVHMNPPSAGNDGQSACPDPRAHQRPLPPPAQRVALSFWAVHCMTHFSTSNHAPTFARSLSAFPAYITGMLATHSTYVLAVHSNPFPQVLPNHPQNVYHLMYSTHDEQTLRDTATHGIHTCELLNCPLVIMHDLRTTSRTIGSTSINQLVTLMTERLMLALSPLQE
jgi:hypothetical protein